MQAGHGMADWGSGWSHEEFRWEVLDGVLQFRRGYLFLRRYQENPEGLWKGHIVRTIQHGSNLKGTPPIGAELVTNG